MMREAQKSKMEAQVQGTANKIEDLSKKLSGAGKSINMKDTIPIQDWAARYDMWSSWEDIEELNETLDTEKTKLDTLKEGSSFMGHYHDHAEERRIFDLPEPEKVQHCERYRLLGNYLTIQGFYSKALEHFQIALSYYEYCFPETVEDERRLSSIRHACLCNASLCAFKLSMFRESLEYAAQILRECKKAGQPANAKAYYRRAHAWKALGRVDCAMNDFEDALSLCPGDGIVEYEIHLLKKKRRAESQMEKQLARQMLSSSAPASASASASSIPMPPPIPASGQEFVASGVTNTDNADVLPKILNIYLPLEGVFVSADKAATPPPQAL
jgi:tetratricopeptide (TPR) repeat protein